MSVAYNPKIVTNGLVAYWDAANKKSYSGSGTTWIDLSGNGNTGTLTNGPTFDSGNRGSIVFDGVDDKVDCGNSNASVNNLSAISGIVWLNKTGTASGGINADRILTKRSLAQDSGWWDFLTTNTQILSFNADFVTTDIARETTGTISLGVWNMVAFTWDGSSTATNIKMYINGRETTYGTTTNGVGGRVTETTNRLVIGGADWAVRPFYGKISNCQLYNRVLTAAEILQNYNATKGRFGL